MQSFDETCECWVMPHACINLNDIFCGVQLQSYELKFEIHKDPRFHLGDIPLFLTLYNIKLNSLL